MATKTIERKPDTIFSAYKSKDHAAMLRALHARMRQCSHLLHGGKGYQMELSAVEIECLEEMTKAGE